jgi:hypothetical protein
LACVIKFPSSIAQPHLAKIAKQTNKMSKKGDKHEKAKTLVTGLLVTMAGRERDT